MTMPPLPGLGTTNWMDWAAGVHDAAEAVTEGRLTDAELNASVRAALVAALTIDVRDYGAALDGVTPDQAAINSVIDAVYAAGGGMVRIPATAAGCVLQRRDGTNAGAIRLRPNVHILCDGTRFILRDNASFVDAVSTVTTQYDITANVAKGDTTFTVASTSGLAVGQDVWVLLGRAVYDPDGEVDYWHFATVMSLTSTTVTLDVPSPIAVTVADIAEPRFRSISIVTELMENCGIIGQAHFENDMTGGGDAEAGIYVQIARNVSVGDIGGQDVGAGLFVLQFVDGFTINRWSVLGCVAQGGQASKGRAFSVGESRAVHLGVGTAKGCQTSFGMFEARSEMITMDTYRVENTYGTVGAGRVFQTLENAQVRIGALTVTGYDTGLLDDGGTVGNDIKVGALFWRTPLTTAAGYVDAAVAQDTLEVRGVRYTKRKPFVLTVSVPAATGQFDITGLPTGLLRNARVSSTGSLAVGAGEAYVMGAAGGASEFGASTAANLGKSIPLPLYTHYGSTSTYRNFDEARTAVIYRGTGFAGSTVTFEGEVWLPETSVDSNTNGGFFNAVPLVSPYSLTYSRASETAAVAALRAALVALALAVDNTTA